jgi:REP element-mobilizing transposase RayT
MSDHNRRSPRLKDFDYAADGAYFLTVCTANRENIFGEIQDDKMVLSHLGKIAEKYWQEIPNHFSNTYLDEFIVMPNHIHGIIWIENPSINTLVGNADLRSLQINQKKDRTKMAIPKIIHGFKSSVTRIIRRQNSSIYSVWQKSFFDRVIRDEAELNRIRNYICQNPESWEDDEEKLPLE